FPVCCLFLKLSVVLLYWSTAIHRHRISASNGCSFQRTRLSSVPEYPRKIARPEHGFRLVHCPACTDRQSLHQTPAIPIARPDQIPTDIHSNAVPPHCLCPFHPRPHFYETVLLRLQAR